MESVVWLKGVLPGVCERGVGICEGRSGGKESCVERERGVRVQRMRRRATSAAARGGRDLGSKLEAVAEVEGERVEAVGEG